MQPNATTQNGQTGVQPYKQGAFDAYISWRALGGLIIDEDQDNKIRQMKLAEFCDVYNVDRSTLWRWRANTPDLAARIEQRRNEIVPAARVSAVYNQLFLTAMQSQDKRAAVEAQRTFLGHFGNLQLPVQRQDIKIQGGLAEVLQAAADDGILEGEVIEPSNIDATTSGQDTGALPPAS